jgi:hypothetical protein
LVTFALVFSGAFAAYLPRLDGKAVRRCHLMMPFLYLGKPCLIFSEHDFLPRARTGKGKLNFSTLTTMTRRWVKSLFSSVLTDNVEAYRASSDLGETKSRTELIEEVAEKIISRCHAANVPPPENLTKVFFIYSHRQLVNKSLHSALEFGLSTVPKMLLAMSTMRKM